MALSRLRKIIHYNTAYCQSLYSLSIFCSRRHRGRSGKGAPRGGGVARGVRARPDHRDPHVGPGPTGHGHIHQGGVHRRQARYHGKSTI